MRGALARGREWRGAARCGQNCGHRGDDASHHRLGGSTLQPRDIRSHALARQAVCWPGCIVIGRDSGCPGGLLADPEWLRVVAALVLGTGTRRS
jgi:hypothetical protein